MDACVEAGVRGAERREPRAGVQPTGFLLGLSSDWRVSCASANLAQFAGIEAAEVLGRPLASIFTAEAVHLIRNRVALLRDEESPDRLIDRQLTPGGAVFDAMLRLSSGEIVLEVVPGTDPGGIDVAGAVERMLKRVENHDDVAGMAEAATRELRGLTGFDGIQIYRNDPASLQRIASFVRSGLSEFEPANVGSDELRRPQWVADCAGETVPILCGDDRPISSPALLAPPQPAFADAVARAGAHAAVLLPIAGVDEPWGFALALHRNAREPRLARLSVAELFAHMLGLRIQAMM